MRFPVTAAAIIALSTPTFAQTGLQVDSVRTEALKDTIGYDLVRDITTEIPSGCRVPPTKHKRGNGPLLG